MVSVTCPCVECVHNGRRNKCTAKNISLTFRNMATVNEGRVDMWVCNMYEKFAFSKELEAAFSKELEAELIKHFGLKELMTKIGDAFNEE